MPDVTQLREDLGRVIARGKALTDQFVVGSLPAEKKQELDTLKKRAGELKGQLDAEIEREATTKDFNDLDAFLNAPNHRLPGGVGEGEDDTHKALKSAGWEVKSGIIMAPTSLGEMVPMYSEDVLFGDVPKDVSEEVSNFFKTTRRAFQPDYRKAYIGYLRLCGKMHDASMAWSMLQESERKALSEGTDTAGGFLVPPDAQAEILVRLPQRAVVRRSGARVQPTSRDVLLYPMVQPAAATAGGLASGGGSIFSSGFVGSWAGETPAFTDVDPAFGSFQIPVRKLRVATKLSNDFLADAMVNPLTFLSQNGAENMALVEDYGFLAGDGTPLQPMGILNSGLPTGIDVEGSTSNTVSNTTANAGSAPKLIDVEYALPSQYTTNARWLMKRSIEGKVRKLIDANGRFLWPTMGGYDRADRSIDGYPVENSEFMPADGTDANKVILFGDFSYYIIAQRAQVTSTILRERFADTDQTGIILWERVGGATWNVDAFRVGIV